MDPAIEPTTSESASLRVPAISERTLKCRVERPHDYPTRFPVPDSRADWAIPWEGYRPPFYEAPSVIANDSRKTAGGWADPEGLTGAELERMRAEGRFTSFHTPMRFDEESGLPLNPFGRTGVAGRGLLGHWGANFAADPMVVRPGKDGGWEMIVILRGSGEWAIPGGMVDPGEKVSRTLLRELGEETGVRLRDGRGAPLYEGFCDDPRNTDNAWMETSVSLFVLSKEEGEKIVLRAGSEERDIRWMPLVDEEIKTLYASHGAFARLALEELRAREAPH